VTFRESDGRVRTLRCFGETMAEQVHYGLLHLPEGRWTVQCRSTPASILRDLRGRKIQERHGPERTS
jgi:hypothetical protein